MLPNLFRVRALLAVLAGVSVLFGACAEPDEIDRTQPDLLDKSMFEGEWYFQQTMVRAPFATVRFFRGYETSTARGVFEIEEDNLILYRTYEFVQGVEAQGLKSDSDTPLLDDDGNPITYEIELEDGSTRTAERYVYRSTPLARFAIKGHYDVRKQYNALTGEESNVTVEDSSEKYWWQRRFIRVDFGINSAFNASMFTDWNTGGGALFEGEEAAETHAFRVEDDGSYFDYVNVHFFPPTQIYFPGFGYVPMCLFYSWYTGAYLECDSEQVDIRNSFMRVPEDNGYEPNYYNDHMLGKFGFFRSERAQHDQFYGQTFNDATRQTSRFDIWENWVFDDDGNAVWEDMTPKPIVFHLSAEFPVELMPGALDLQDQWNEAFVATVKGLKGADWEGRMWVLCENNSADVQARLAADPNALVATTDEALCGGFDEEKYLGDLRYSFLNSVNDPTQVGLYGYGPSSNDPITGKVLKANANQYTANIRLGARNAVDMVEYEAGVQSFRDITQSEHITTKMKAKALKGTARSPMSPGGMNMETAQHLASHVMGMGVSDAMTATGFHQEDTDHARARMHKLFEDGDKSLDFVWANPDMAALAGIPIADLEKLDIQGDELGLLEHLAHPLNMNTEDSIKGLLKRESEHGNQALCMGDHFDDTIRGVALEYKAVYDKAVCEGVAAAVEAGDDVIFDMGAFDEPGGECYNDSGVFQCGDKQVCTFLSQGDVEGQYCMTPCNVGDLLDQLRSEIRRVNQIDSSVYWDPNALYADAKDDRVRASQLLVRDLIEPVREQVFLELFDRIWSTVALHEVGHTMGLRHNFSSSTDALNFFPEYWDLKGATDDDGDWHPTNLWERETRYQSAQRLREYQQTSVMEYGSGFTARFSGLGAYDHAAIAFGYGGLLNVFNNAPDLTQFSTDMIEPHDTDPTNYPMGDKRELPMAKVLRKRHHTNFPEIFGSVDNMLDRRLVPWEEMVLWREQANEETGAMEMAPVACDAFDNPYSSDPCGEAGSFCQAFPTGHFCTKPDMVEVPYRFCSDEYNYSSASCQTRDEGVDPFEIVANSIDDYEGYWPFRAYKRDSDLFFPSRSYWNSIYGYFIQWRKHFELWTYDYVRYNKAEDNGIGWWENRYGKPWHLDINGGLSQTLAARMLFEHLANVFGRPSDGYYGWNASKQRYEPVVNNGKNSYCNYIQVREDVGARPMYPSYDFAGYLYTPARAGTFYDRLLALQLMTYPRMIFTTAVDEYYDVRRFRLSFADVWPQRMQNILSAMITGDPSPIGWCIEHQFASSNVDREIDCGTAEPVSVKPRLWFGDEAELAEHYDNCEPLTTEPEYSFPTTQYRLPAIAMIYGMVNLARSYDRTFTDRVRLWLDGDGGDITIPDGFDTISYTDPFSGKTYIAAYDPNEFDPNDKSEPLDLLPTEVVEPHGHLYWPAAWLVARANDFLAEYGGNLSQLSDEYAYSDLQQMVGRLEIIRGIYRRLEFGY